MRVVLAADDNYARPLAVAGRSVITNLAADRHLELYVLDNGIGAENHGLVMSSFHDPRVRVVWIEDVAETIASFPTYGFFSTAAYARLLIPSLLPADIDRVIYIDCDVLARRDLGGLYDLPLDDFAAPASRTWGRRMLPGRGDWPCGTRKAGGPTNSTSTAA